MRNHNDKVRDMARSILPSSARHWSRARKQGSARRARARNTARLINLMAHIDDLDAVEEPLESYDLDDTGWGGMVEDRRNCDKVAPLVRWAEARIDRTPHLANGDYWARYNHFADMLGDSLIGRHALSHLEHLFGEENPWAYGRYPGELSWAERSEQRRIEARAETARRERLLDEVLGGAGARRLNQRIRVITPPVEQLWTLNKEGERVIYDTRGCEPWILEGDRHAWLDTGHIDRPVRRPAQDIAFEALTEVHAEMFGWDC